ncbi:MAG: hypothetical protein JNL74_02825 [Fibrobacteres bacterium]|nr:hypothetical protein [Fibrobacterota bacterium]
MGRFVKTVIAVAMLSMCLSAENTAKTTIGGYGEIHLNGFVPDTGKIRAPKFDFHRFVLTVNRNFTEKWSFFSEVEIEHNYVEGNKASGYLILEQAYLRWQISGSHDLRFGIILQPQGLLNERHEPATFSSVERPEYHRLILPSTWFGAGIAMGTNLLDSDLRCELFISEGLNDRKFGDKGQGIREARQKGYNSSLDNVMATVRTDYTGFKGVKVGTSIAVNETVLDNDTSSAVRHIYQRAVIGELHAEYRYGGLTSLIEFGSIHYEKLAARGGKLTHTQGLLVEAAYDVLKGRNGSSISLSPFVRYSRLNTSGVLSSDDAFDRIDGGIALKPHSQIVIKADFGREYYNDSKRNMNYVNLGAGYDF